MEDDEYKIMYDLERTYWWFVGKQFLVNNWLKRFTLKGLKKCKILDIGCGTGIVLKLLENFGTASGMEFSPQAIHFLRQRNLKRIVRSDANQSIPFKNDTFSVITCLDVLEHLENDLNLVKEMVRVCAPGGYILVTVPAFDFLWSPHDVALHHKRRYTRKQVFNSIRGLNCSVIKASYYNTILCFPILAARKLKCFFSKKKDAQSDFFIAVPDYFNKALSLIFIAEIYCLKFFNFPFGVSFLLIIQKSGGEQSVIEEK